jgi:hypothetical protein
MYALKETEAQKHLHTELHGFLGLPSEKACTHTHIHTIMYTLKEAALVC